MQAWSKETGSQKWEGNNCGLQEEESSMPGLEPQTPPPQIIPMYVIIPIKCSTINNDTIPYLEAHVYPLIINHKWTRKQVLHTKAKTEWMHWDINK